MLEASSGSVVLRDHPEHRRIARAGAVHETARNEVIQDRTDDRRIVTVKALEKLPPGRAAGRKVIQHGLPQRAIADANALAQALYLLLITPNREPEHVGRDLPGDAVAFDLLRELEENLVRDVSQGCTNAGSRGELRNEHRGLMHDGVDQ